MTALQMETELMVAWYALPIEKRREALDFMQFLRARTSDKVHPLQSGLGLCGDLGLSMEENVIDEARREAWGSFPREEF